FGAGRPATRRRLTSQSFCLKSIFNQVISDADRDTRVCLTKLFAELGAGSFAVGVVLVVLIPFLRKLITDKAETPLVEAATACRVVEEGCSRRLKTPRILGSARVPRAGFGDSPKRSFLCDLRL